MGQPLSTAPHECMHTQHHSCVRTDGISKGVETDMDDDHCPRLCDSDHKTYRCSWCDQTPGRHLAHPGNGEWPSPHDRCRSLPRCNTPEDPKWTARVGHGMVAVAQQAWVSHCEHIETTTAMSGTYERESRTIVRMRIKKFLPENFSEAVTATSNDSPWHGTAKKSSSGISYDST